MSFLKLEMQEVRQLPALQLAYIGDAVYELAVRQHLLSRGPIRSDELHKATVHWVQAPAQAVVAQRLLGELTEAEAAIFYRGRNVKPARVPKRATVSQYCYSTALEAVFGYLYLTKQERRLQELLAKVFAVDPQEK